MAGVAFPDGTGLGRLFAVPAVDWIAIDDRVTITIDAQNIAPEIEQYIPNYPDLLQACIAWRSSTWSGLITQRVNTEMFAAKAADVLGQLSSDLSGVKPGDPVPESVSFIIRFSSRRWRRPRASRPRPPRGSRARSRRSCPSTRSPTRRCRSFPLTAGPRSSARSARWKPPRPTSRRAEARSSPCFRPRPAGR
jgi:hypothetical protein